MRVGSRIARAKEIDGFIQKWFERTGEERAKPKDVMPFLVKHGVFTKDYREGLPLRKVLRELDRSGDLQIMKTVHFEQRKKNKLWFFLPVRSGGGARRQRASLGPRARKAGEGPAAKPVPGGKASYIAFVRWRGARVETLADIVDDGLVVLFVGLNPSLVSVARGHYHQGRLGQQFWRQLVAHRILPQPGSGQFHDQLLVANRLGITDLVKVPSARADSLDAADIAYGRRQLRKKIRDLKPKIVCSVYKGALEELCEARFTNQWGPLDARVEGSRLFIMPFPYRPKHEVSRHMRQLRRSIEEARQ